MSDCLYMCASCVLCISAGFSRVLYCLLFYRLLARRRLIVSLFLLFLREVSARIISSIGWALVRSPFMILCGVRRIDPLVESASTARVGPTEVAFKLFLSLRAPRNPCSSSCLSCFL